MCESSVYERIVCGTKKKLYFVLRFVRNVAALKHFSQHFS